jgi:RHS repeat-associated protein
VHLPNGKAETFAYDPLGRRVSASNGEKTVSYVYDGQNVHLEYEGSGGAPASSPSAVYTDGLKLNEVLEMARGGKRYSYLTDGLGSTLALADESGHVSQRYSYDAFGDPTPSGSLPNPFLYTGQMWEPEAGLYYDRARWYEPESGQFISRNPRPAVNPYSYVSNDPANVADPTGEFSIPEINADEVIEGILDKIGVSAFQREAVRAAARVVLRKARKLLTLALEHFGGEALIGEVESATGGAPESEYVGGGLRAALTIRAVKGALAVVKLAESNLKFGGFENSFNTAVKYVELGLSVLAMADAADQAWATGEFVGTQLE